MQTRIKTWPEVIDSLAQAKKWLNTLAAEGLNLNPDDSIRDYMETDREGNKYTVFTSMEADWYENLMADTTYYFTNSGEDIHEYCLNLLANN